jgi:membrane protein DedA with SNARE-associated domain
MRRRDAERASASPSPEDTAIDLPGLINSYGYLAVFVGAFLEGETILALSGLAAFRGYLDFRVVVVVAGVAGFLGDQFFFFLGRRNGARILAHFPQAQARALRFDAMLSRWHAPLIVAIRFMYGFRIAGPILLGMGRVPAWKFTFFNLLGAAIWAPVVAGFGLVLGTMIDAVLRDVARYEIWFFAALAVAGLGAVLAHRIRARRRARRVP